VRDVVCTGGRLMRLRVQEDGDCQEQ